MDKYQKRYEAHQLRKKMTLIEIMKLRHSERMFSEDIVPTDLLDEMVQSVALCPSSCDRKAIHVKLITDRDEKALLGGVLVGGVGWIHRAPAIILIFADPIAYKAGDEIKFMPFLDAGVVIEALYLKVTELGLSGCFANPNIRPMNKEHFEKIFGSDIYCGAFALGYKND